MPCLMRPPPNKPPHLRDFLVILKRRKAIAIQAFIVVVALGAVLTFMAKPTYRSTSRILVENKVTVMALNNTTNPFSDLLLPSSGQRVETQVEILRASDIAAKAAKDANVQPGSVFLEVRRVADTNVIELSTVSQSATAAFEYLKAVPRVYLNDLRADRMREVSSALAFAQKRLTEENARLKTSERALLNFKQKANIVDPTAQRAGDLEAAASSAGRSQQC